MTAPPVIDLVRDALLAVVDLHGARDTYEPLDAAPMTICGECGHDVAEGACPTVEMIAVELDVDLDGVPAGQEVAVIRLALDVMSL